MARRKPRKHLSPHEAYKTLYRRYGPQGWWPVTPRGSLAPRYISSRYAERADREAFEICAGAILTQNTSWKNAERAIVNLNGARLLSCAKIANLSRTKLAGLIRPSGYYNQKAGRLKAFALYIVKHYGGRTARMFSQRLGPLRVELLGLDGIGPETADSIILYAAGKPSFVVDAYTLRLGKRLGWFSENTSYDEAREYLSEALPRSLKLYNEFHALIVAAGKDNCRKNPSCVGCPLKKGCEHVRKKR